MIFLAFFVDNFVGNLPKAPPKPCCASTYHTMHPFVAFSKNEQNQALSESS